MRCAKLEKEDVAAEIDYWQQAVLCSVLGANPPFEGFIKRIWATLDIDKIILVRKGVFLVRFGNVQDKQVVEKRGVYYFDLKLFLVKDWNPKMDMHTEALPSPLGSIASFRCKILGAESLSKIGSTLGIPLKTDHYTKERTMLRYARLLIDISLDSSFPDFIEFFNDNEVLVRQQVVYEWEYVTCAHCHMFGHEEQACRKKGGVRQEWRRLQGESYPMASITSWNRRGLNWPNKQKDVHSFLQYNKVGMIGLLETKVKENNVEKVAGNAFPCWYWPHNFEYNAKGSYNAQVLKKTDQFTHCYATQMHTHKKFYITFVYGMNQEQLRESLWSDLQALAQHITEAWCILGDFNSILYKEDRMGGIEVQDHEVQDLSNLLELCDL
ncbi:LOW QUALITY PROTEIN: hypothetical protein Cgig2_024013 [Carnegiea gigantea]|uniref:DUF4283 domain-containing protein n=1 Tax=Carnegiea gigantea TaxID=171969 RepID=A0A9Q1GGE5_9CARY|nr:LOW QUALITY PROTEIN: hypothetical protein Cgig2_024013 [Carnegiea gigantea]